MSDSKRKVLSLKKKTAVSQSDEPATFILDVYDLLLPCRSFHISYKVSEVGRVSLTTEFLLRLLHSIDGMEEVSVAEFFGFNRREMTFVLTEAESHDYINRVDGRLWLSATGRGLFIEADDEPRIYDVEKRDEWFDFDLVSLAPQPVIRPSRFEMQLPEIQVQNLRDVSGASDMIRRQHFKRFFSEIATRRDSEALEKRSLYSVDSVSPGERKMTAIQVIVHSPVDRPGEPEPDLSYWRSGHELEDRISVLGSVARFLDERKISSRPDDGDAYRILLELAPEFLKEYTRRDGFAVDRYFTEWVGRKGGFRTDRKTIPIIGSLFTPANYDRVIESLNLSQSTIEESPVEELYWLAPQRLWGITNVLPKILSALKLKTKSEANSEGASTIAIFQGHPPRLLKEAFDETRSLALVRLPTALEILVLPGILAAALVHAPIKCHTGVPVPLGFLSIDLDIVARTQKYVQQLLVKDE